MRCVDWKVGQHVLFQRRLILCFLSGQQYLKNLKNRYEKNELEKGEESPLGLLLCAEGNYEQIELLQLEKSGIRIAEYITELPSKELLQKKLHKLIEIERKRLENKKDD